MVLGLSIFLLFNLLIPPQAANAQMLDKLISIALLPATLLTKVINASLYDLAKTITQALLSFFTFIGFILQSLIAILFAIAAFIFGVILKLNFEILNPTSPTYKFISTGWTITRDVANLGFVLFIILIALGTIVRFKDYEAKKALPRLIGAAILVNFSLAIPAVFINFSHILSNYFLSNGITKTKVCSKLVGGPGIPENNIFTRTCDLTVNMANMLQPQKLLIAPNFNENDAATMAGQTTEVQSGVIAGVVQASVPYLNAFFLMGGVFVMVCYAMLFLVRFVALHFLLVLGPLVWLFWVIPGMAGYFNKWWTKFLQYVFFAPAAIFFLYLTILIGKGTNAITAGADPKPYLSIYQFQGELLMNLASIGAINFVMIGFLIGGLLVSQHLSIHGASNMVNFAKSTGKKARAWAQKKTAEGGKAAVASRTGQNLANTLSRNKLTAPLGNWLARTGFEKRKAVEAKADKRIKAVTHEGARMEETKKGIWRPSDMAAYNRMVQDKGKPLIEEVDKKDKDLIGTRDELGDEKKGTGAAGLEKEKRDQYNDIHDQLDPIIEELKAESKKKTDPTEKANLIEKITSQQARVNSAKDAWDKAKEKRENAEYNMKEAQKSYDKALDNFEEFEDNALKGFSAGERRMWKDAKFNLSKTQFAGSARLRDRQVPEISTKGIEKEINRLNDILKDAGRQKENPLLNEGERLQAERRYNQTEKDLNGLQNAHVKLVAAKKEQKSALKELSDLEEKHGVDKIPETDRIRVWGRIQKADDGVKEAKHNIPVLRVPAFISKEKGGGDKKPKKKPVGEIKAAPAGGEESGTEEENEE